MLFFTQKQNQSSFDVDSNLNLKFMNDICNFLEKNTFQDRNNRCINSKTKVSHKMYTFNSCFWKYYRLLSSFKNF